MNQNFFAYGEERKVKVALSFLSFKFQLRRVRQSCLWEATGLKMFNNIGQMNQGSWRSLERRPGHGRQLPAQSAMASSSQASLTGALGDVCHHSWAMVFSMTADKDELLRDLLPCWPDQGE